MQIDLLSLNLVFLPAWVTNNLILNSLVILTQFKAQIRTYTQGTLMNLSLSATGRLVLNKEFQASQDFSINVNHIKHLPTNNL